MYFVIQVLKSVFRFRLIDMILKGLTICSYKDSI